MIINIYNIIYNNSMKKNIPTGLTLVIADVLGNKAQNLETPRSSLSAIPNLCGPVLYNAKLLKF